MIEKWVKQKERKVKQSILVNMLPLWAVGTQLHWKLLGYKAHQGHKAVMVAMERMLITEENF